ncbi:hypothetical protein [Agrilutibacter solisilvae]|uniref:DUF4124 domain-containing protein n=1 Tax=Agrilutibacter solisilvae TaxID=2763317 RepID=A0A974Y0F3_9GAMM|nr:hypothetical protein [Lysobacter solisilvae]QSX79019.1 hypothetical protein I8J32_003685 [Lysobacter solisilvae]
MNKPVNIVSLAAVALLATAPTQAQNPPTNKPGATVTATKKLYCWDEAGKRVCGDALPANAVDSARTEISPRSGLPTSKVDRALTAAEREARAQETAIAEQAAFAAAAQRMRELAMAESYDTEADLRRAFGERIALLDDTIKASQLSIGSLRLSLVSLLRQAGEAELGGKPVQATLTGTIRNQHGELMRQQALLVQHRRNRSEIDKDLAHALERYRALKNPEGAGGGSAAREG